MLKRFIVAAIMVAAMTVPAWASPYLVSDPNEGAESYIIVLENDPATTDDDQTFELSAQPDGSLRADLVNFPAGVNNLKIAAANVWGTSVSVGFSFSKDMPGVPSNVALVNINGSVYLQCAPQESVSEYRVVIDGESFYIEANLDGSLSTELYGLEDGTHSIEAYAINKWGDSLPAPFTFKKQLPSAPLNLQLM